MVLVFIGLTVGSVFALWLTRSLATLLYNVNTTDPVTYVSVAALLAGVGAVSCLVPAVRATRVEPVSALRGTSGE